MKNATNMSPRTQNKMFNIIGIQMIQKKLIEMIKKTRFHALIRDEVTSYNNEVLSSCFCFVCSHKDKRESSLDFAELEHIPGSCIAQEILRFYERSDVKVTECRSL